MFYEWLLPTHLVLSLSFGCQASESQHSGWGEWVEVVAVVVAGRAVFGIGLESRQEEERAEGRTGLGGCWPSYGFEPLDCHSHWHRNYFEEGK